MNKPITKNIKSTALLLAIITGTTADAALSTSGSVSTPTPGNSLYVANGGNGTLDLNGGSYMQTAMGKIGYTSGTTGTVNLNDAGTHWNAVGSNSADIRVGYYGTGSLNVNSGAKATTDDDLVIAYKSGSTGTVNVDGQGSHVQVRDYIYAGYKGNGTLNITNGGTVQTTNGVKVGYSSGSEGRVNVDGNGSLLDIHCGVYIGNYDNGRMDVTNGGRVQNYGNAQVGAHSTGTLNVSGQGSVFTTRGRTLYNGYCSTGRIDISDGGQIFNTNGNYANNAASTLAFGLAADYLEPNDFWAMNINGDVLSLGLLEVYLTDGYELGANQTYDFFNIAGSISSYFDGIGQGDSLGMFGDYELFIDYTGGDGNDIVLFTNGGNPGGEPNNPNAVPEPVTFALSSLGLLALNSKCGRRSRNA